MLMTHPRAANRIVVAVHFRKIEGRQVDPLVLLTTSGFCSHRSWGFGRIKTNWAFLDFENGMKPYLNDTAKFWPVASILMNCHVCLYGSATAKYFDCETPTLEQYLTNFGLNV
jgi:hypothetical protein